MPNLVTVVGENTHILPHMLKHYEDKVDKVYVVVYRQSNDDGIPFNNASRHPFKHPDLSIPVAVKLDLSHTDIHGDHFRKSSHAASLFV